MSNTVEKFKKVDLKLVLWSLSFQDVFVLSALDAECVSDAECGFCDVFVQLGRFF